MYIDEPQSPEADRMVEAFGIRVRSSGAWRYTCLDIGQDKDTRDTYCIRPQVDP
jgi:hypothetical protein